MRGLGVARVFLHAEVRAPSVSMWMFAPIATGETSIGPWHAGADMVDRGEIEDALQPGDAARVDGGDADVVDQLFGDQLLAVPDRVEDLAQRDGRGRVLADQAEALLQLRRDRVLQPEEAVGFEILAEPRGLDGGQAVVGVVQEVDVPAHGIAQLLEELRDQRQVLVRRPDFLGRHGAGPCRPCSATCRSRCRRSAAGRGCPPARGSRPCPPRAWR